jgi:beta-phosphoglucomutase-like phosphatase (HAD superfamily)
MEKELVDDILEEMGLSRHFPDENRVCSSSGYGSEMQQMLGGALRLERRPDHCIVFSATPQSAGACRQVEMKNVAIVSPYPYYELTTSDMTVRDFGSIGVRNLKNVFSEITIEEPMLQIQVEEPRILRQTMLKTRFWDDGDR